MEIAHAKLQQQIDIATSVFVPPQMPHECEKRGALNCIQRLRSNFRENIFHVQVISIKYIFVSRIPCPLLFCFLFATRNHCHTIYPPYNPLMPHSYQFRLSSWPKMVRSSPFVLVPADLPSLLLRPTRPASASWRSTQR